jgi:acetate kinase
MGFSPLEGLMMATRPGDVDAGVLLYLQREAKLSLDDLDKILNSESGLLGVSGITGDMRALLTSPDPRAQAAIELFCYRARKYIGAYMAVLGGCDGIVFGGGIGESSPIVRKKILQGLEWTGLVLDVAANDLAIGIESRLDADRSRIGIHVVPVDEMKILATTAQALISRPALIEESAS